MSHYTAGDLMRSQNLNWTAGELLEAGRCTAQCLCATDPLGREKCTCPCRGLFHGQLANSEVVELKRHLVLTQMSELRIHYWVDRGTTYAWHTDRPNILGEGTTQAEARDSLERLTDQWGHAYNPEGYLYVEGTSANGSAKTTD